MNDLSPLLRVIVADDQASVREGLVLLLGLLSDIDVVASAADGQEAIRLVAEHQPDAILLDLHMPVLDGIETTRLLTEQFPCVAIVVLTTYADDASVIAALGAGARSYLTKDADRADIAFALRSATTGLGVLDPVVQANLVAAAARGTPARGGPAHPRRATRRADPEGGRDPGTDGAGLGEPRYSFPALPERSHREEPHQPDLRQDGLRGPGWCCALRPGPPSSLG